MRIFVGMDLSSKWISFLVIDQRGYVRDRGRLDWEPEHWREVLSQWDREEVTVAFETGPEAYRAERILMNMGVESYPFHAANFVAVSRSKKKTDRIDAEKIARGLSAGCLPARVQLPNDREAHLRNLVTEREGDVRSLQRYSNRLQGLARQWGVKLKDYNRSQAWWEEAMEAFPSQSKRAVKRIYRCALTTLQNLEEVEEEIQEQVKVSGREKEAELLQTIPGIGQITANSLVAYLGDGRRFRRSREFASYVGFTPSVDQTGEAEAKLGKITRQGPPVLRRLLVQVAHIVARSRGWKGTRWRRWFEKLKKRRGYKVAIVGLARRLAELAYAVVRSGKPWSWESVA